MSNAKKEKKRPRPISLSPSVIRTGERLSKKLGISFSKMAEDALKQYFHDQGTYKDLKPAPADA
jgi:hypothetical protein